MSDSSETNDRRQITLPGAALTVLYFALGFGLVSQMIRPWMPYTERGNQHDVLRYLEVHKDDFDLMFFGSSRTKRGIIPELFDQEMATRGHVVRSLNLGVGGMGPHEANAFLEHVLSMRPARLRTVVFELDSWHPRFHPRNRYKRRAISWHNVRETLSVCRSTLLLEAPWRDRAELTVTHLLHMGARYTNLGAGPAAVRARLGHSDPISEDIGAQRGYAERSSVEGDRQARQRFLDDLDAYEALVDAARGADETTPAPPYNTQALLAQVAAMRQHNVRLVYVLMPDPNPLPEVLRLDREGHLPDLIRFDDPDLDGRFFEPDYRHDQRHLARRGAEELTRALARRWTERLDETNDTTAAPNLESPSQGSVR